MTKTPGKSQNDMVSSIVENVRFAFLHIKQFITLMQHI